MAALGMPIAQEEGELERLFHYCDTVRARRGAGSGRHGSERRALQDGSGAISFEEFVTLMRSINLTPLEAVEVRRGGA